MQPSAHPLLPPELQASYRSAGLWQDINLMRILVEQARRSPDAPLYVGDDPKTYAEVATAARRFAAFLADRGVGPGHTVVAPLVNGWEATAVLAATVNLGARLAPLPSRATRSQLRGLLDATDAAAVVISGRVLARADWQDTIEELKKNAPSLRALVLTDAAQAPAWASGLADVTAAGAGFEPAEVGRTDTGAPFLLLSTGGTTGPSKVVMHAENAAVYAATQYAERCGLSPRDVILSAGPFGHASGTVFTLYAPIIAGASVLPVARWEPRATSRAVDRYGVTWCLLSGTHIYDMLELDDEHVSMWSSVRGLSAGSGSDERYAAAERRFGFRIRRMYGLTECMGHAVMPVDAPQDVRMARDGLPFDGVECFIEGGGDTGEYLVRGPSLMLGYLHRPELTAEAVTGDGYLHTGDIMSIDGSGFVRYVGRLKDVIRRSGINIDPLELERLLVQHPDVNDISVVGVPHPRLGEQAVAVVVPRPGSEPALADLTGLLSEHDVPRHSHPERLVLVAELPKTEFGKHNKAAVRQMLADTERTHDR
ncbi:(2,3-dihydroxybenzoyl)adenylate synthase [Actinomadura vinacea]|uniref:(2,3-dihydroxybenzoyl)adenylate synthase n=1 Tax=Actinomadura vinacea TaxID=115336 RepID=A0ABN3K348_9ACTN